MAYFNLEYVPQRGPIDKAEHTLNRKYKGAQLFAIRAPDAFGTLHIWAHDEEEAREHLVNACFDLIFNRLRVGAFVDNPKCIFCEGRTQSGGRNSAGTRVWNCQEPGCRRKFVVDRIFRGGINHPSQSKKPAFAKLLLAGTPVRDAADQLGVNPATAANWAAKVVAANRDRFADLKCPCGRPLRHRGICVHRMSAEGLLRLETARKKPRRRRNAEVAA